MLGVLLPRLVGDPRDPMSGPDDYKLKTGTCWVAWTGSGEIAMVKGQTATCEW